MIKGSVISDETLIEEEPEEKNSKFLLYLLLMKQLGSGIENNAYSMRNSNGTKIPMRRSISKMEEKCVTLHYLEHILAS